MSAFTQKFCIHKTDSGVILLKAPDIIDSTCLYIGMRAGLIKAYKLT